MTQATATHTHTCAPWCSSHADLGDAQICEAETITTSDGTAVHLTRTTNDGAATGEDYIALYLSSPDLLTRAQAREIAYALLLMAERGGEVAA